MNSGITSRKKLVFGICVLFLILIPTSWLIWDSRMDTIEGDNFYNQDARVFVHVGMNQEERVLTIRGNQGYLSSHKSSYVQYTIPFNSTAQSIISITSEWNLTYYMQSGYLSSVTLIVSYLIFGAYYNEIDRMDVFNASVSSNTKQANVSRSVSANSHFTVLENSQYWIGVRLTIILSGSSAIGGTSLENPCSLRIQSLNATYSS